MEKAESGRTCGGETRCRNICCIPSPCPASDIGQLTSEGSAFSVATESNETSSTGYHSNTWAHMGALRCCMMRWVNQRDTAVFVHEPGRRRCLMNDIGQMGAWRGAKMKGNTLMTVLNIFKWFGELCVETTTRIATCKSQLCLCIWKWCLMTWSFTMDLRLGTVAVMNSNFSFALSKYLQQGAAF